MGLETRTRYENVSLPLWALADTSVVDFVFVVVGRPAAAAGSFASHPPVTVALEASHLSLSVDDVL